MTWLRARPPKSPKLVIKRPLASRRDTTVQKDVVALPIFPYTSHSAFFFEPVDACSGLSYKRDVPDSGKASCTFSNGEPPLIPE